MQEGGCVFLKVSSMKGIMRFCKKGKLVLRYIGPFPIVKRFKKVTYKLDLPKDLKAIHLIFHVSLSKYILDESYVLKSKLIQIDPKFPMRKDPL